MPVYKGWEFPSIKIDAPQERYLKLIIAPETTGYPNCSIFFSHIPVGGTTGMHTHSENDEIMHFVGRGVCIMDGKEVNLETDSVVLAPKGIPHECKNTSGTETLKLFCVFIPAIKPGGILNKLVETTKTYLSREVII